MSFLLRAALVIGALSYLAATRDQPNPIVAGPAATSMTAKPNEAPSAVAKGSTMLATVGFASAAWSALPAETRQHLAQEAMAELGRHVGSVAASRDTLAEADRKAAWRGTDGR